MVWRLWDDLGMVGGWLGVVWDWFEWDGEIWVQGSRSYMVQNEPELHGFRKVVVYLSIDGLMDIKRKEKHVGSSIRAVLALSLIHISSPRD